MTCPQIYTDDFVKISTQAKWNFHGIRIMMENCWWHGLLLSFSTSDSRNLLKQEMIQPKIESFNKISTCNKTRTFMAWCLQNEFRMFIFYNMSYVMTRKQIQQVIVRKKKYCWCQIKMNCCHNDILAEKVRYPWYQNEALQKYWATFNSTFWFLNTHWNFAGDGFKWNELKRPFKVWQKIGFD